MRKRAVPVCSALDSRPSTNHHEINTSTRHGHYKPILQGHKTVARANTHERKYDEVILVALVSVDGGDEVLEEGRAVCGEGRQPDILEQFWISPFCPLYGVMREMLGGTPHAMRY